MLDDEFPIVSYGNAQIDNSTASKSTTQSTAATPTSDVGVAMSIPLQCSVRDCAATFADLTSTRYFRLECPMILVLTRSRLHKAAQHGRSHHCSLCSMSFNVERTLRCHQRTVHSHVRRFRCPECSSHPGFKRHDGLLKHRKRNHSPRFQVDQ